MITEAIKYIKMGWLIFPVHSVEGGKCTCGNPECKNGGKHPIYQAAPKGFHNATNDINTIKMWWENFPWANIAVRTGRESGIVVIDVDKKPEAGIDGDETLKDLEAQYGKLPETVEAVTGSGGRHIYFKYPQSMEIKSGANVLGDGIDIRANGGYVVVPPSINMKGEYFWDTPDSNIEMAMPPAWILDRIAERGNREKPKTEPTKLLLPKNKVQEIRSALTVIPAEDYDTWLRMGMALHSTGAGNQAFGLWVEWSQKSEKYNAVEQQKTWNSFTQHGGTTLSTLFGFAKDQGWHKPVSENVFVDECESHFPDAPIKKQSTAKKEYTIPRPDGILGDIADYITETAYRQQPLFSLTAALAIGAVATGRKYATETGLRSNLYLVNLGATGCGKEHARKVIKEIFQLAERSDLIGEEEIASGQAINARLAETPNVLFPLDEFGKFMQAVNGQNSGSHLRDIASVFLRLFGESNSIYTGKAYADRKRNRVEPIEYPCVTIYGTSTPETFFESLTSDALHDGFINRLLVIPTEEHRPEKNKNLSREDIPEKIIQWVKDASSLQMISGGTGNLVGVNPAKPIVIKMTDDAKEKMDWFENFVDERIKEQRGSSYEKIWSRSVEMAAKLSMIYAICENEKAPEINFKHVEWSVGVITHFTGEMISQVEMRLSSSPFERNVKELYQYIMNAGEKGLTKRETQRRMARLKPKELDEAIQSLMGQEKIDFRPRNEGKRGRPGMAYVAIEDIREENKSNEGEDQ